MMSELPFRLGDVVTRNHTFTQEEFDRFAALSGDHNPIHVDPRFAADTRFGRPVAHGMLLYGVIAGLLSEAFPTAVQLEQNLMFTAPTYTDEPLTIRAEVVTVDGAARQARLATTIRNGQGESVCQGESVLTWSAP